MIALNFTTGSYNLDKALKVCAELNSCVDDDWKYTVVDCKNGWGRIDVYDEDGELVEKGFLID